MLFLLFSLTSYFRVSKVSNELHNEAFVFTGAIALHYLPIVFDDLQAHVLDNFWKYLFHGFHGLSDFLYFYLVIHIFNLTGLPITPYNIYVSSGLLILFSILIISLLSKLLFSNRVAFLVFIFLSANVPLLYYSKEATFMPVAILIPFLLFLSFYLFYKKGSIFYIFLFPAILTFAMGTEMIFYIPILIFYIICVIKNETEAKLSFKKTKNIIIYIFVFLPGVLMFIFQFYIYKRLGVSGLGLLGRVKAGYSPGFSGINFSDLFMKFNSLITETLGNKLFFYSLIFVILLHFGLLVSRKIRFFSYINFIFVALLFHSFQSALTFNRPYVIVGYAIIFFSFYLAYLYHKFSKSKVTKLAVQIVILVFIAVSFNSIYQSYKSIQVIPERCYKSVGYFVRKYGPEHSKVFNFGLSRAENQKCEYYYGKNFMIYDDLSQIKPLRMSKHIKYDRKLLKLIYSDINISYDSLLEHNKVTKMDFYVFYYYDFEKNPEVLSSLESLSFKKVAEVYDNNNLTAEIFSKLPLKFQQMDMKIFNKKWEEEYAHLYQIYEHHRIGITSIWGSDKIMPEDIE